MKKHATASCLKMQNEKGSFFRSLISSFSLLPYFFFSTLHEAEDFAFAPQVGRPSFGNTTV
jgi:hypothetical protein